MKTSLRMLALLVSILLFATPLCSAADMTAAERIEQAQQYVDEQRYDDALFALDLADAQEPQSDSVFDMRLQVLIAAEQFIAANQLIDTALAAAPTKVSLYVDKARLAVLGGDVNAAADALRRAMVTAGGDAPFAADYAPAAQDVILSVADGLAAARDYEAAMRLYQLCPMQEGENELYDKALQRVFHQRTPIALHPGIEDEAFDTALSDDRLALVPSEIQVRFGMAQFGDEIARINAAMALYGDDEHVLDDISVQLGMDEMDVPIEEIYSSSDCMSLSPDGDKLFQTSIEVSMILDLQEQQIKLIAPESGIDGEYVRAMLFNLLANAEDSAVCWSNDGRYIALSFPRNVLLNMRFGCNILLIDVEAGTVKTLVEDLPAKVSLTDPDDGFNGAPFRATFDPDAPILYYEAYGAFISDGTRFNELRAYNLDSGETRVVATSESLSTTTDPHMWMTPQGIATTFAYPNNNLGYGLAFYASDGTKTLITAPNEHEYIIDQRGQHLIDIKNDRGLLYFAWNRTGGPVKNALISFTLEDLSPQTFTQGIAIAPGAPAAERLIQYELASIFEEGSEVLMQIENQTLLIPHNAALSPDGRYMILATLDASDDHSLYIHDFERGITGKLDISALSDIGEGPLAAYAATGYAHRGLRWLNNNRLVVDIDSEYRIFELAIG